MSLVRNSATIGALTLVSRILGFARDMLMRVSSAPASPRTPF